VDRRLIAGQRISWLSFGKRIFGKVWKEWQASPDREPLTICAIAETEAYQGTHFHPRIIEDDIKIE
jgi:hypothetical protein